MSKVLKIKIEELSDELLDKKFNQMAIQEFYGRAQYFDDIRFEFDGLEWEFFPYFGPQLWVRPVGGVNHPKSKFYHWHVGSDGKTLLAEIIKEHFMVKDNV